MFVVLTKKVYLWSTFSLLVRTHSARRCCCCCWCCGYGDVYMNKLSQEENENAKHSHTHRKKNRQTRNKKQTQKWKQNRRGADEWVREAHWNPLKTKRKMATFNHWWWRWFNEISFHNLQFIILPIHTHTLKYHHAKPKFWLILNALSAPWMAYKTHCHHSNGCPKAQTNARNAGGIIRIDFSDWRLEAIKIQFSKAKNMQNNGKYRLKMGKQWFDDCFEVSFCYLNVDFFFHLLFGLNESQTCTFWLTHDWAIHLYVCSSCNEFL